MNKVYHIREMELHISHRVYSEISRKEIYGKLRSDIGHIVYFFITNDRWNSDAAPLIVNADLPLEAVSKIAMNREESNLYNLIIVVKDGQYIGAVSIMKLLNNITELQVLCAHNSNPLTGLPGNLVIEEHLQGFC